MVEQLHFHSSKWLFSLSTHELLIKIGKDIIYLQREAITLEDMLTERLKNVNKPETHFLYIPT